jgi:hypothetical protein
MYRLNKVLAFRNAVDGFSIARIDDVLPTPVGPVNR